MQSRLALHLIALLVVSCNPVQGEQTKAGTKPTLKSDSRPELAAEPIRSTKLLPGKVWSMHQSTMILGEFDVLINAKGVIAACKRSGITFVAQAPNWIPMAYSSRSAAIWKAKKESFSPVDDMCKALPILGLPNIWLLPVVHTGHQNVSGFACESFSTPQKWNADQVKQYQQGLVNKTFPRSANYQATEIDIPKPAYRILEKIYGTPPCSLMPIEFKYTTMKGSVNTALRTDTIKQVTPPKNWLELPANFKAVKTFNELNMDQGAQAGAEDLFGH